MKRLFLVFAFVSFQVSAAVSTNNEVFIETASLETLQPSLMVNLSTNSPVEIEVSEVLSETVALSVAPDGKSENGVRVKSERVQVLEDGSVKRETLPGGYRQVASGLNYVDGKGNIKQASLTPSVKASGAISFPESPLLIDIASSANLQTVVETRRRDQEVSAKSAVAAITYYDTASQSSVVLANVVYVKPEAHAGGAVFYDAFDQVDADILYTVHSWGLEQDVVIFGGLPTPDTYDLNPDTTYLCVLTELIGLGNDPDVVQRHGGLSPSSPDASPLHVYKKVNGQPVRIHDFQKGVAYESQSSLSIGGTAKSDDAVTVKHRIYQSQGRWFLSEEVPLSEVLKRTPEIFQTTTTMEGVQSLPKVRPEPTVVEDEESEPIQGPLLSYQPRQHPAFVVDYLDYSGTVSTNITFETGETYYISSDLVMNGSTLRVMPGAIVKFATNAAIKLINGASVDTRSHALNPAIFTSAYDTNIGQNISGYTGSVVHTYNAGFIVEFGDTHIQGIRFKYAQTGIRISYSAGTEQWIEHCEFYKNDRGVEAVDSTNAYIYIANALFTEGGQAMWTRNTQPWIYNCTIASMTGVGISVTGTSWSVYITDVFFANMTNPLIQHSGVLWPGPTLSNNGRYNATNGSIGTSSVTLTNNPFKTGPYGSYYLDQSCGLINAGSKPASDWPELYHFTTATNGVKETNSYVDIGYHYGTTNDYDGDGLYDFIEDSSGNGSYESSSYDVSNWMAYDTDGDGLNDYDEYITHGTNPQFYDTDGDGFDDVHEIEVGSDPLSASSYPVRISGGIAYAGSQTGSLQVTISSYETIPYSAAFDMPFTTNGGSYVTDWSGRGGTGTVQGATWSSNGISGGCYSFDGNDRILIGDLGVIEGQTNATFAAWIKRTGGDSLNGIMGKTVAGDESMYLLLNSSGQGGSAYVVPQSKALESYANKSPIVTNNHWIHLAGVYRGTNMTLYANGMCVATGTTHALEGVRSNNITAAIGDVAYNRGWYFTGLIDEVKVYQYALSGDQVKAMVYDVYDRVIHRVTSSNNIPSAYSSAEVPNGSNYWVVAWVDTNGNGYRDCWEPYGSYTSNPVLLSNSFVGATITLTDPDTDGDGVADWSEKELGTDPFDPAHYPTTISGAITYTGEQAGDIIVRIYWESDLLLDYDFDATNEVRNKRGNKFHGAVNGAAYDADGQENGSYRYDGVNDYILVGPMGKITNGTISYWINADVRENYRNPFTTDYAGWDDCIRFESYSSGVLVGGGYGLTGQCWYTASMTTGDWNHVVLTWNSSNAWGYYNGNFVFHSSHQGLGGTIGMNPMFDNVAFGNGYSTESTRYWKGKIDSAKIYNRTLNGLEVSNLFAEGEVYTTNDFKQLVLSQPGPFTFTNMPTLQKYRIVAWRDADTNGVMDELEAQGEYLGNLLYLTAPKSNVYIRLFEWYLDSDGDGMTDGWEYQYGFNPFDDFDGTADADGDGITNAEEYENETNPYGEGYIADAPEAKILIKESGIYRIRMSNIAEVLNIDIGAVSNTSFSLRNMGTAVPTMRDQGDVLFYGEKYSDIYTDHNAYILKVGPSITPSTVIVADSTQTPMNAFVESVNIEEQIINAGVNGITAITNALIDPWLWKRLLLTGLPSRTNFNAGISVTNRETPGDIELCLFLNGASSMGVTHTGNCYINSNYLGSVVFSNVEQSITTFNVPNAWWNDSGSNNFQVSKSSGASSTYFVDKIVATYQRLFILNSNPMVAATSIGTILITNIPSTNIAVWNISNPLQPQYLTGYWHETNTIIRFSNEFSRLLFCSSDNPQAPHAESRMNSHDWLNPTNSADYMMIVGAGFETQAMTLASYRSSQDLAVVSIPVDDVFNAATCGRFSGASLRLFMNYVLNTWSKPPDYVVLVGDGSMDYKNNAGSFECRVPTELMAREAFIPGTPFAGVYSSDAHVMDCDLDGYPDYAVGRIPVNTTNELAAYIDNIITYEAGGPWRTNTLIATDTPDVSGNYPQEGDALEASISNQTHVLRADIYYHGATEARIRTTNALANGVGTFIYIGHGFDTYFSSSQLLKAVDVTNMSLRDTPSIFLALACQSGMYGDPDLDSITEVIIKQPGVGAAALAAGTYISMADARYFSETVFGVLYNQQEPRLGDAFRAGKVTLQTLGRYPAAKAMQFLGDPALMFRGEE